MSDLPENLQIKRELSPPSTPEGKSPKSIKAKLSLHVKRRLQDLNQSSSENAAILTTSTQIAVTDIKQEQQKAETIRQKRPYHKRTEKNKSSAQLSDSTIVAASACESTTSQRKYKHKIKQIVVYENQEILTEDNATVHQSAILTAGSISAGDEDDGGHDNDLKAGREKEKCPDILGMVLSMKKRILMQDPEVQHFLKEMMDVIKN